MKVLLAGGTGFVGRSLVRHLVREGHECIVLVRKNYVGQERYFPTGTVLTPFNVRPDEIDAVINLAGEPVAGSWSEAHKKRIMDSRVDTTRDLVQWIATLKNPPKVFLSASAIGFYGDGGDEELTETSRLDPKRSFLAQVCILWEQEANVAKKLGIRAVNLRLGNVIHANGGFLFGLAPMLRFAPVYSPIAPKAFLSWISMRDTVRLIEFALKNDEVQGPMNVVSPNPTTNREFYKILGKVKGRPVLGAMPSAILRKIVGPFSEAILASQRVVPAKALDHGFQFEDTDIAKLLSEQLSKKRQGGKDKNSGK